jgi:hypothetical protein
VQILYNCALQAILKAIQKYGEKCESKFCRPNRNFYIAEARIIYIKKTRHCILKQKGNSVD